MTTIEQETNPTCLSIGTLVMLKFFVLLDVATIEYQKFIQMFINVTIVSPHDLVFQQALQRRLLKT